VDTLGMTPHGGFTSRTRQARLLDRPQFHCRRRKLETLCRISENRWSARQRWGLRLAAAPAGDGRRSRALRQMLLNGGRLTAAAN